MTLPGPIAAALHCGGVIPAHPLALDRRGRFDERRQRALTRYYLDAGAAGVAIGVHTTQFAIRDPRIGLHRPVLELGREAIADWAPGRPVIRIAGVVGSTRQALREAALARDLGYHLALVSLGGLGRWSDQRLLGHLRAIGEILPVMGFYLQPAVGGRPLSFRFWRAAADLPGLVAIKVAPFDRYRTLEVIRAVAASGRSQEIALYTGNDDAIVADLTTRFRVPGPGGRPVSLRFVGGLLGHWACWTRQAVRLVERCRTLPDGEVPDALSQIGVATTDANGALFDAANGFRGCLAGIHEILRRQGLLATRRCLDPREDLSPGQAREIDRVTAAYPFLTDDAFVAARRDRWLA